MAIVVLQHHPHESVSALGTVLQRLGHRLVTVRLFAGEPVPTDLRDVDAVISMGGPMNVDETGEYPWIEPEIGYLKAACGAEVPIVGICLGCQLLAVATGGKVARMAEPEVGWQIVRRAGGSDAVFDGMPVAGIQFHAHGQEVAELPPGAVLLASSNACRHQAFRVGPAAYGIQYHFEWTLADIDFIATDPLFAEAGLTADALAEQTEQYYARYRRGGELFSLRLAEMALPRRMRR